MTISRPPVNTAPRTGWYLLIVVTWTLVNMFLLFKNGRVSTGEAEKYISEAQSLVRGAGLEGPNHWLYATQIGLLAFCIKLKLGFSFALLVQYCFSLFAAIRFYQTILYFWDQPLTALLATFLLLFNLPYQEFNSYLQTESLFFSLTLLYSCYLLRVKQWTPGRITTLVLWLGLICITRPSGILFMGITLVYGAVILLRGRPVPVRIISWAGLLLLFWLLLDRVLGVGGELDFMLPFKTASVICGVPTIAGKAPILLPEDGNSVGGLLYYIVHNPAHFSSLAWAKTISFFGLYRSYYRAGHNIYLVIFFWGIYALALAALPVWYKCYRKTLLFLAGIIFITWLTVILTCDDWHNRFFLSISPFLIMIASGTAQQAFGRNKNA